MTTETRHRRPRWHETNSERWSRELADLDATGWPYKVTKTRMGVGLIVHYPLPSGESLRLRVRFPATYPWLPPDVFDADGQLGTARHVHARSRELCLMHDGDWDSNTTVAALLTGQVPRLMQAGQISVGGTVPAGLEVEGPEPVGNVIAGHAHTVIVNDIDVPTEADSGALLTRFSIGPQFRLGTGVVETIFAPGVRLDCDLDEERLSSFHVRVLGRWLRDPGYVPGETPAATWRRVAPRLAPLEATFEDEPARTYPPESLEIIGLLVPDEITHRTAGESWVFLGRIRGPKTKGQRRTFALDTQYLSRSLLTERTPAASILQHKDVVVVGLGAIGMPIAQDLAQSQVGRLLIIDPDRIDVRTGCRQAAGLMHANSPKAWWSKEVLSSLSPYCSVDAVRGRIEGLWEFPDDDPDAAWARELRQRLHTADVVVDACASPPISRFLSEIRRRAGKPLLVASGTAGGWGGIVTMLTSSTGCWACVEHARVDGELPAPPADATGMFTPIRCSEPTYQGARHQSQTIAMHASAVTIAHLTGEQMEGDYFVATMRDSNGRPIPVSWTAVPLPRHPACPLHGSESAAIDEPPTQTSKDAAA